MTTTTTKICRVCGKEKPNTICAWADYDAGLIQGFKDGAKWAFGRKEE